MLVALSFHKFRHVSLNSDVIGWELKCLNIYWCLNARLCFKKVGRDGPVRHSGRTGIRPQRDRPTEAYLYRPFNGYFCCCNSKLKIYRIKTVNRFTDFFFCPPPLRVIHFFSSTRTRSTLPVDWDFLHNTIAACCCGFVYSTHQFQSQLGVCPAGHIISKSK